VVAAGVAAWSDFLGRERIEAANRARPHPMDLVAVDDQGVCAFVAWDAEAGEITRLFTHPRAWGRGAGTALLDQAVDALRAAGCSQAWLYTDEHGPAARFYERRGWRLDGDPRVRDWRGTRVRESRYVLDL
jgi:GNAT superfamily N-acetyltransferase